MIISMNQKGFVLISILVILVTFGLAGGGYYYLKSQQIVQPSDTPLISDEESLTVAKQTVVNDLTIAVAVNCLIFTDEKEDNFIVYTVTRRFNNNCSGDPSSTSAIPKLKIDRMSGTVLVQSLDGEFRLLSQSSTQDTTVIWKTFREEVRKFEIKYPDYLSARKLYTHNIIVCFDNQSRPFAICIDDEVIYINNDPNTFQELQLDALEKKLNTAVAASFYDGHYSVAIHGVIIYSEDRNLLQAMLQTLQIFGQNPGVSK